MQRILLLSSLVYDSKNCVHPSVMRNNHNSHISPEYGKKGPPTENFKHVYIYIYISSSSTERKYSLSFLYLLSCSHPHPNLNTTISESTTDPQLQDVQSQGNANTPSVGIRQQPPGYCHWVGGYGTVENCHYFLRCLRFLPPCKCVVFVHMSKAGNEPNSFPEYILSLR